MYRAWVGVCLLGILAPGHVLACGDKFFTVGRGTRFQRSPRTDRPATILAYARPGSNVAATMREKGFLESLKSAGHKLRVVEDASALSSELRRAAYDLVLADLGEAAALESQSAALAHRPSMLPVLFNPTPDELLAARGRYACVVNSPKEKHDLLAAVDEAMRFRAQLKPSDLEGVK